MTTSASWLEDLIDSIGEKTAQVDHTRKKLLSDDYDKEILEPLLKSVLNLRRKQMDQLLRNGEKPNPNYWCDFKHALKSYIKDAEVYEATLDDESFENMKQSADILAGYTSLFLGMEFADCATCLYDRMLINQLTKEKEK
mgnify:CR=1 FL=1